MNKLLNILTYSLLVVCVLAFNYACTEYDTPTEIADDGTIDTGISTKIHRKVLWINIDGAVGEVVKNSLPADGAIAKMLKTVNIRGQELVTIEPCLSKGTKTL